MMTFFCGFLAGLVAFPLIQAWAAKVRQSLAEQASAMPKREPVTPRAVYTIPVTYDDGEPATERRETVCPPTSRSA